MIGHPDLTKFGSKGYRDEYMQTQVRAGIAYQFQALRKKFGLKQTEMAQKVNKPQSTVSRLENTEYGRVSIQTLLDVASSLDVALLVQFVSYPDFLSRTEDMSDEALQVHTIFESLESGDARDFPEWTEAGVQRRNLFPMTGEGDWLTHNRSINQPPTRSAAGEPYKGLMGLAG